MAITEKSRASKTVEQATTSDLVEKENLMNFAFVWGTIIIVFNRGGMSPSPPHLIIRTCGSDRAHIVPSITGAVKSGPVRSGSSRAARFRLVLAEMVPTAPAIEHRHFTALFGGIITFLRQLFFGS
jgi:hypothetical protein